MNPREKSCGFLERTAVQAGSFVFFHNPREDAMESLKYCLTCPARHIPANPANEINVRVRKSIRPGFKSGFIH